MNYLIEPCCAKRHLQSLRKAIGKDGTAQLEGYGDLSLTELMPAILTRYDDVEMLIVAPTLPDQAAEVIAKWLRVQWARMDGKGKVYAIRHLTVVANLSRRKSPVASAWKKENEFGERLTLVDTQQNDTAILLPDFAITGPVNLQYGEHFVATATTDPERVAALWKQYNTETTGQTDDASLTETTEKTESTEKMEKIEEAPTIPTTPTIPTIPADPFPSESSDE